MTGHTRGRPTLYKGIKMRSRLEATFAAWLDTYGQNWTYEPQCFADTTGQYLPDFRVDHGVTVDYYEVKPPTADTAEALRKMHIIRSSEPRAGLWVVVPTGNYPRQGWAPAGICRLGEQECGHCGVGPTVDLRSIPGANRRIVVESGPRREPPTDPNTGRARIGGRARGSDGRYLPPKVYGPRP